MRKNPQMQYVQQQEQPIPGSPASVFPSPGGGGSNMLTFGWSADKDESNNSPAEHFYNPSSKFKSLTKYGMSVRYREDQDLENPQVNATKDEGRVKKTSSFMRMSSMFGFKSKKKRGSGSFTAIKSQGMGSFRDLKTSDKKKKGMWKSLFSIFSFKSRRSKKETNILDIGDLEDTPRDTMDLLQPTFGGDDLGGPGASAFVTIPGEDLNPNYDDLVPYSTHDEYVPDEDGETFEYAPPPVPEKTYVKPQTKGYSVLQPTLAIPTQKTPQQDWMMQKSDRKNMFSFVGTSAVVNEPSVNQTPRMNMPPQPTPKRQNPPAVIPRKNSSNAKKANVSIPRTGRAVSGNKTSPSNASDFSVLASPKLRNQRNGSYTSSLDSGSNNKGWLQSPKTKPKVKPGLHLSDADLMSALASPATLKRSKTKSTQNTERSSNQDTTASGGIEDALSILASPKAIQRNGSFSSFTEVQMKVPGSPAVPTAGSKPRRRKHRKAGEV